MAVRDHHDLGDTFEVVLLSDASTEKYPDNTPTRFTNALCERYAIRGNYEVAMASIVFDRKFKSYVPEVEVCLHARIMSAAQVVADKNAANTAEAARLAKVEEVKKLHRARVTLASQIHSELNQWYQTVYNARTQGIVIEEQGETSGSGPSQTETGANAPPEATVADTNIPTAGTVTAQVADTNIPTVETVTETSPKAAAADTNTSVTAEVADTNMPGADTRESVYVIPERDAATAWDDVASKLADLRTISTAYTEASTAYYNAATAHNELPLRATSELAKAKVAEDKALKHRQKTFTAYYKAGVALNSIMDNAVRLRDNDTTVALAELQKEAEKVAATKATALSTVPDAPLGTGSESSHSAWKYAPGTPLEARKLYPIIVRIPRWCGSDVNDYVKIVEAALTAAISPYINYAVRILRMEGSAGSKTTTVIIAPSNANTHYVQCALSCADAAFFDALMLAPNQALSTPNMGVAAVLSRDSTSAITFFCTASAGYPGPFAAPDVKSDVMVYTDIIRPQVVAEQKAMLLGIAPMVGAKGDRIVTTFDRRNYCSVQTDVVDSVTIELRDTQGELIPAAFGGRPTIVTLQFRHVTY